ncbi:hypothetical protein PR048_022527 [Dryococelus australis]|uniref:Uncharacterized protein n=1 Tax=Dryococelus australis TaxID=614101 RepID=A0ABQ9H1K2_9NEOP|nr:hypothetical protein PR048_022527 [Dryococelus australis]
MVGLRYEANTSSKLVRTFSDYTRECCDRVERRSPSEGRVCVSEAKIDEVIEATPAGVCKAVSPLRARLPTGVQSFCQLLASTASPLHPFCRNSSFSRHNFGFIEKSTAIFIGNPPHAAAICLARLAPSGELKECSGHFSRHSQRNSGYGEPSRPGQQRRRRASRETSGGDSEVCGLRASVLTGGSNGLVAPPLRNVDAPLWYLVTILWSPLASLDIQPLTPLLFWGGSLAWPCDNEPRAREIRNPALPPVMKPVPALPPPHTLPPLPHMRNSFKTALPASSEPCGGLGRVVREGNPGRCLFHLPTSCPPLHRTAAAPNKFPLSSGVRGGSKSASNSENNAARVGVLKGGGSILVADGTRRTSACKSGTPLIQCRRAGEMGDPREDLPTNGIVRHDSHMRKSGVTRPGIETGSRWWGVSRLTAQPSLPHARSALAAKRRSTSTYVMNKEGRVTR